MRVLVTGGTGFLGRHVVWRLRGLGHEVVFTGRSHRQASAVMAHAPRNAGHEAALRFVALSHGQADGARHLLEAAQGAGAMVHCAALSSPWGARASFERANVESTREAIAACAAQQVRRLVHISTPGLYFNFRDRIGIREDEPLPRPVNDYVATKAIAERLVYSSAIETVTVLRPRALIGPWDSTLLPRLLRVARQGRLPLMRGGSALLDLTYVDNAVDAVLLSLGISGAARATFNISNGEPMRVIDLYTALSAAFGFAPTFRRVPYPVVAAIGVLLESAAALAPGWEPPITRYSAGLLAFSQTLDLTRARQQLGYEPRVALADGLARTAAWFAAQGGQAAALQQTPA